MLPLRECTYSVSHEYMNSAANWYVHVVCRLLLDVPTTAISPQLTLAEVHTFINILSTTNFLRKFLISSTAVVYMYKLADSKHIHILTQCTILVAILADRE